MADEITADDLFDAEEDQPATPAADIPTVDDLYALEESDMNSVNPPSPEDEGITGKDLARFGIEAGGGIAAAYLSGGLTAPASIARLGPLAAQLIPKLIRPAAAGLGAAAGSLGSETFDPSEHPLRRAAITGALDAVGEGVIGPAISKLAGGGTKLVPGGKEYIEDSLAAGITPSVGRATENRALDVMEAVSESSLFGGGRLSKAAASVTAYYDEATKEFVKAFRRTGSREAVEDLARESIEGGADAFRLEGRAHYKAVDDLIESSGGSARVPLDDVMELARAIEGEGLDPGAASRIRRLLENRTTPATSADVGIVDPSGNPILMHVAEDTTVPFALAAEIRSDLLGISRQGQDLIGSKGAAIGKRLAASLDRSMQKAAKGAGPKVLGAWRKANGFWKRGLEVYNSSLIKNITKQDGRSIFAALEGANPRLIRRVRTIINDPELWKDIQGEFLFKIMNKSETALGEVGGAKMAKALKNFGDESMNAIFTPVERDGINRLLQNLTIAQGNIGEGIPGRIFIQLAQAGAAANIGGAVLGMTSGKGLKAAATILLVPSALAHVLTNKAFIKWSTIGRTVKPGSKLAINAASQMMAIAISEGGQTLTSESKETRSSMPTFSATFGGPAPQRVNP